MMDFRARRTVARSVSSVEMAYAAFTFLSCLLELGLVLAPLRHDVSWIIAIPALVAFHVANLVTYVLTVPRKWAWFVLVVGTVWLAAEPWGILVAAPGVLLAKLGIQWLRNDLKAQEAIGERFKAFPRLLGFALGIAYSPIVFAILAAAALISSLLALQGIPSVTWVWRRPSISMRPIYLAMATHSAHYFAFGYGVPLLFYTKFDFPFPSLGATYVLGWLGYYVIDKILPPRARYISVGHMVSALAIIVLYFSSGVWAAVIAWVASGFGGGTIFMLPLLRRWNPYDQRSMDLWDNGSNVIGLVILGFSESIGKLGLGFVLAALLALGSALFSTRLREDAQ